MAANVQPFLIRMFIPEVVIFDYTLNVELVDILEIKPMELNFNNQNPAECLMC